MGGPTLEQVERILEVMAEWGLDDEIEIRERYSGRMMYGEEVVAITGDGTSSAVFVAIGILMGVEEFGEEAAQWFSRADSMGRGWVIY